MKTENPHNLPAKPAIEQSYAYQLPPMRYITDGASPGNRARVVCRGMMGGYGLFAHVHADVEPIALHAADMTAQALSLFPHVLESLREMRHAFASSTQGQAISENVTKGRKLNLWQTARLRELNKADALILAAERSAKELRG